MRLKPAPGLVFEGHEPEGYTGDVVSQDDFGLGYGLEDFFRLRTFAISWLILDQGAQEREGIRCAA
jgi:hypothetical protein